MASSRCEEPATLATVTFASVLECAAYFVLALSTALALAFAAAVRFRLPTLGAGAPWSVAFGSGLHVGSSGVGLLCRALIAEGFASLKLGLFIFVSF